MLKIVVMIMVTLSLGACSHAPSVSFLGAFFPAWLLCITVGIVCTLLVRVVLFKIQCINVIGYLPLVYSALTTLFSLLCWLLFFQPQ